MYTVISFIYCMWVVKIHRISTCPVAQLYRCTYLVWYTITRSSREGMYVNIFQGSRKTPGMLRQIWSVHLNIHLSNNWAIQYKHSFNFGQVYCVHICRLKMSKNLAAYPLATAAAGIQYSLGIGNSSRCARPLLATLCQWPFLQEI